MPRRYGSFASARVAIPLGAALVAALVLPAILLHSGGPGILPFAAPAASGKRIVHTHRQPQPKLVPKQHATRHHAKPAASAARTAPVYTASSAPAARHDLVVHTTDVKSNSTTAKAAPKHATAQPKHAKAQQKHAKTKPNHTHPVAPVAPVARVAPVTNAAPATHTATADHPAAPHPKRHDASHVKKEKVHGAAPQQAPTRAPKDTPKAHGQAKPHGDTPKADEQAKPNEKGKP